MQLFTPKDITKSDLEMNMYCALLTVKGSPSCCNIGTLVATSDTGGNLPPDVTCLEMT